MTDSEFSQRVFAMGEMVGIRSFKVDSLGRLTGVTQTDPWRPGENQAVCRSAEIRRRARSMAVTYNSTGYNTVYAVPDEGTEVIPEHRCGSMDCECGFWAYWKSGYNPHHKEGQVLGIVRGYGVVTHGTRGFRSEKAEILCLINQEPEPPEKAVLKEPEHESKPWWKRALTWAQPPSGLTLAGVITTYALTGLVFAFLIHDVVQAAVWWALGCFVGGWSGAGYLIRRRERNEYDPIVSIQNTINIVMRESSRSAGSKVPQRTQELYGLPVFNSITAALAEYPLTVPPEPTPETDPDFWTRSAK